MISVIKKFEGAPIKMRENHIKIRYIFITFFVWFLIIKTRLVFHNNKIKDEHGAQYVCDVCCYAATSEQDLDKHTKAGVPLIMIYAIKNNTLNDCNWLFKASE